MIEVLVSSIIIIIIIILKKLEIEKSGIGSVSKICPISTRPRFKVV
jgi:hypothetical protein